MLKGIAFVDMLWMLLLLDFIVSGQLWISQAIKSPSAPLTASGVDIRKDLQSYLLFYVVLIRG